MAVPLCTERTVRGATLKPIIHILADGGLTAYRIYPETFKPDPIRLSRILNIVFPRTLKHHVLLHAIFGHEIGHAAWAIPRLRSTLLADVIRPLFHGTRFEDAAKADVWMQDPNRPIEVAAHLAFWTSKQPQPFAFSGNNNWTHYYWVQEFFCDLFGVVTFGPSFACAHKTLLGSLDPTGALFSSTHPPYASRALLVARAFRRLGWLTLPPSGNAELDQSVNELRAFVETCPSTDPWYELFTDANIDNALDGLRRLLGGFPEAQYQAPDIALIKSLTDSLVNCVPPTGAKLRPDDTIDPGVLDFRHTLFAGWLAWIGKDLLPHRKPPRFLDLNKICDRSILQQMAVDLARTRPMP
jgi:dCTP deaminase